jgi:lysophospholipase L1-like esterase
MIKIGVDIAKKTIPYSREVPNSDHNILLIGDSTVVGVGAESPELSIAGRVGKTFPDANIINKGISGEKLSGLASRIENIDDEYDLIMIHIGGNDVVRFTSYKEAEKDLERVLIAAQNRSKNVILTSSGNLGTAILLPLGSRNILENRSRHIRSIFLNKSDKHQVPYVDLFLERDEDPFALNPSKFYAKDMFHPSGEGYALWYVKIEKELKPLNLD